jgi:hypothetical protein
LTLLEPDRALRARGTCHAAVQGVPSAESASSSLPSACAEALCRHLTADPGSRCRGPPSESRRREQRGLVKAGARLHPTTRATSSASERQIWSNTGFADASWGCPGGAPERTPARIRLRHWACGTPEVPSGVRTGVVGAPVATRGLRADGHVVGQVPWTPPHTHAFAKRAQQTWLMCPRVLASPRRQLSNASSDSSAGLRSRPGRPLRSPSRDTWALEAMTPAEGMKPPWRRGRQEHVTARYVLPSTSSIQPSPATV